MYLASVLLCSLGSSAPASVLGFQTHFPMPAFICYLLLSQGGAWGQHLCPLTGLWPGALGAQSKGSG